MPAADPVPQATFLVCRQKNLLDADSRGRIDFRQDSFPGRFYGTASLKKACQEQEAEQSFHLHRNVHFHRGKPWLMARAGT
jgi:hypothetical protein